MRENSALGTSVPPYENESSARGTPSSKRKLVDKKTLKGYSQLIMVRLGEILGEIWPDRAKEFLAGDVCRLDTTTYYPNSSHKPSHFGVYIQDRKRKFVFSVTNSRILRKVKNKMNRGEKLSSRYFYLKPGILKKTFVKQKGETVFDFKELALLPVGKIENKTESLPHPWDEKLLRQFKRYYRYKSYKRYLRNA